MSDPRRLDRIMLTDHVVEAEIGAYQDERGRRQRLRFSISVDVDDSGAADDDVDRIVSYDLLTEAVAEELAAERLNLLETLAERIARRVLAPETAVAAQIRIEKLDLGPGALGVEIVRHRRDVHVETRPPVRPVVYHLGPPAVRSAGLRTWLDEVAARPAVLCVEADGPRPGADAAGAQRRIDLLAIEQAAWVLAGRDRRCVVRETRSELDWALRNGELSVWAPARLALNVPGAPAPEGRALSAWLGELLDAMRLVYVDAEPPPDATAERETLA